MSFVQLHFRLTLDDPFQQRLEECIKTMRHGAKGPFLVNLCRVLFESMDDLEIKQSMMAFVNGSPEAMSSILARASSRLKDGGERVVESHARCVQASEIPSALTGMDLSSLCDDA